MRGGGDEEIEKNVDGEKKSEIERRKLKMGKRAKIVGLGLFLGLLLLGWSGMTLAADKVSELVLDADALA